MFMKQPALDIQTVLRNECAWEKIWMTSPCSMDMLHSLLEGRVLMICNQ